jgi:hypothetical protein
MLRSSRRVLAACVLVAGSATAGCTFQEQAAPFQDPDVAVASPAAAEPADTPVFRFDFDELGRLDDTGAGPGGLSLLNTGSQPVTVRVATAAAGFLRSVPDRDGGYAARFPWHGPKAHQRMVLTVSSSSVADPLGPGTSDFTFGADFTLDSPSEGGRLDNGNNLIQRGRAGDPAQYKLQIDGKLASCRIAGAAGEVVVEAKQVIRTNVWYHVSCARTGDVVTLELGVLDRPAERAVVSGPTGAVYVPTATPLVLGGKTTSAGVAVEGNSDQFNGAMDNVFLSVNQDS